MNPRKYILLALVGLVGFRFGLADAFWGNIKRMSFTFSQEAPVNCSSLCVCDTLNVQDILHEHLQRHRSFMGAAYREDADYTRTYLDFLGIYVVMVSRMVKIKCQVNDGRRYALSTLMNGVDNLKYVSLEVDCQGEELLWDVPTWQVSVNIFVGKNCKIVVQNDGSGLIIPMNMWIFETANCGLPLLSQINIRFTMNTIVLSVMGSESEEIPESWRGDDMISATTLSLRANGLKEYRCKLTWRKDIDTINLERNKLTKFPACILEEQKTGIRFLGLSHNNISDIGPLFEQQTPSPAIQIIDLSHNLINKIGQFKTMSKLITLDLSSNHITEINDDAFQNLVDLQKLHLQNNRIHYIGSVAFRNNVNLIRLNLFSNALRFIRPDMFAVTDSHLELDVRRNKLRYPPLAECAESNLLRMNIRAQSAANPYHCDCEMIKMEECVQFITTNNKDNGTHAHDVFNDLNQLKCASPPENKGLPVNDLSFLRTCVVEANCPQSCSCHLQNKSIIDVNCTARRLLELPDAIPSYPRTTSRLFLSHNPLQLLSYRTYLSNLSEIHVDNCLLSSVTPKAIEALQNVKVLALHNNRLQRLPSSTRNITLSNASNVTLHNNRWACSCDSLWLPSWIARHKQVLWMPGDIVCSYLNKPVEEFSSSDVSCTSYTQSEVALGMALAVVSVASTIFIMCHYGEELGFLFYSKLGMRLGMHFRYGDRFHPYDIFVSYGEDNYKWVVDTLVPRLEEEPPGYKLCLHYRDFPSDTPVLENIPWAIKLSRCSLLVLSRAFTKKEWCVMDLRAVFQRLLMVSNRLIIVVTDDLTPDEVSADLRAYMSTHEYLQVDEPCFWEKLEMILPSGRANGKEAANSDPDDDYVGVGSGDSPDMCGDAAQDDSDIFNVDAEVANVQQTGRCKM